MEKFKWLKDERGASIVWALILFVVLTILATSVLMIVKQDIFEVVQQEKRVKSYYVAQAGIDLSYAALTKNENEYLNKIASNTVASMTDAIEIMDGTEIVGIAEVTVALVTVDGKKWVRVESIGTLTGETVEVKTVMRIDITNPINVIMERS